MEKAKNFISLSSQLANRWAWKGRIMWCHAFVALVVCLISTPVVAQTKGEALARMLQDPLAYIRVLNSESNLDFGTGNKELSWTTEIQPVYAISREKLNIVLRGVIPVVGLAPEAQKPVVGDPLPAGDKTIWGLADAKVMAFFSPKSKSRLKWGLGPLINLPTATDANLRGGGWGGGPAGIVVGSFGTQWTYAAIGIHIAGQNGFNMTTLQPMLFYNVRGGDGLAINYNAMWAYNHQATKGNELTLPLGLSVSKPWVLQSGHALDASIGAYYNVQRPDGAAVWTFRWTLGIVFPTS